MSSEPPGERSPNDATHEHPNSADAHTERSAPGRALLAIGLIAGAVLLAPIAAHADRSAALQATEPPATTPVATPTPTPAPVPAAVSTPTPTPTLPPLPVPDRVMPSLDMNVLTRKRTTLAANGLLVTVGLSEPGTISIVIRDPRKRQLSRAGSGLASLPAGGNATLTVRLTPAATRLVRRRGKLRWTVEATGLDGTGNERRLSVPLRFG